MGDISEEAADTLASQKIFKKNVLILFRALKITFILDDSNKRKKRAGEIWALVSSSYTYFSIHDT